MTFSKLFLKHTVNCINFEYKNAWLILFFREKLVRLVIVELEEQ